MPSRYTYLERDSFPRTYRIVTLMESAMALAAGRFTLADLNFWTEYR